MQQPLFSIIIPTLNEEAYISPLLDSIAKQTVTQFEVIISDGGSTDKTKDKVSSYRGIVPSLTFLEGEANVSRQRNKGSQVALGKWLVFIDADAVLFPYTLERIARAVVENPQKLYTTWFSPDSRDESDAVWILLANMFVEGSLVFHRPIAPGGMFILAKNVFEEVGGFNEQITFGEDYDLTKRLQEKNIELSVIRETLSVFSLRRIRREGKLKFLQVYVKATLLVLFTKKNLTQVPGYFMGRKNTESGTSKKRFLLRGYELRLKRIVQGLLKFSEHDTG